ncbi:MAG: hypothetical protein QOG83_1145, partial [Alphaproteobacteria bacterium]|nr:hypothetical protein [Alphaproteobacteria bacterium]
MPIEIPRLDEAENFLGGPAMSGLIPMPIVREMDGVEGTSLQKTFAHVEQRDIPGVEEF